jgi:predicted  nucleic acid-binding Zn-ribbon protein
MKIVEAMKELKLIEKKIARNTDSIQKYSAQLSNERPYFTTPEAQSKEIRSLVQANGDLIDNYIALKGKIERTNLEITIEMDGRKYSLSELLVLKRKLAGLMAKTYEAMNDNSAKQSERLIMRSGSDKEIRVERFYDEREKMEGLRKWQDFVDNIDSRLEVINATTDIVE